MGPFGEYANSRVQGKKISESNNVHLIMECLTVLLLQGDDDNFVFTYS